MQLVSFQVENYRSIIKSDRVPLSKYSVLIGANNEGKSNILHALALAMSTLEALQFERRSILDARKFRVRGGVVNNLGTHFSYNRKTDFPVGKKSSSATARTRLTLEFQFDENEIRDFRKEVKSAINGTLTIQLGFDASGVPEFTIKKRGRGKEAFENKAGSIATFISKRIRFEYIPAIRTAESAGRVISRLLERELRALESDPAYVAALREIERQQQPIYEALGSAVHGTVSQFLPSVKAVKFQPRL